MTVGMEQIQIGEVVVLSITITMVNLHDIICHET